jgi:hypothetical protein
MLLGTSAFVVTSSEVMIRHEAGQALDATAGRDDHVAGSQDLLAAGARRAVFAVERDPNRRCSIEATAAGDPRDLVLVDKALQARPHPLHDLVAPPCDHFDVEAGLAFQNDPEVAGLLEAGEQLGRFEERLGRDAAQVQARPADLALIHESDAHTQLRGPECGAVAAGAGAQDDQVEVVGCACGHGSGGLAMRWWAIDGGPAGAAARAS